MPKTFGPSFESELVAAGLLGLPFIWYDDGTIGYGPDIRDEDRTAVEAVAAAHDPTVPAPAATPETVSRYQGREAMRLTRFPAEGRPDRTLFEAFEELLNDPTTPAYYRRAWDELQIFERGSAMLNAAADVLGLTQAKRDDLFRLAAAIKA